MSRPTQLAAITLVGIWGCAVAGYQNGTFQLSTILLGYAALIPISISIHYANEYADYETDKLTTRTPFSGGSGALPESGLPRNFALISAWAALILGSVIALCGWILNLLSSLSVFLLALGAFFGWMYSLRPLQLAWRGWGELTNASLGGLLLPTFAYSTHSKSIDWDIPIAFLPFGMLAFSNLLATTWPDRTADAAVGKFTLATRWPVSRLRVLHLCVGLSAVLSSTLLADRILPSSVVLSGLVVIPLILWSTLVYTRWHSPFPSVAAMMTFLGAQLIGWALDMPAIYFVF